MLLTDELKLDLREMVAKHVDVPDRDACFNAIVNSWFKYYHIYETTDIALLEDFQAICQKHKKVIHWEYIGDNNPNNPCPNVAFINTWDVPDEVSAKRVTVSVPNITAVHVSDPSSDFLRSLELSCPHLEFLYIDVTDDSVMADAPNFLHQLRTLHVEVDNLQMIAPGWAPYITHLEIFDPKNANLMNLQRVKELQVFDGELEYSTHDYVQIMKSCPALEQLLVETYEDDIFWKTERKIQTIVEQYQQEMSANLFEICRQYNQFELTLMFDILAFVPTPLVIHLTYDELEED